MFGEAWSEYEVTLDKLDGKVAELEARDPRAAMHLVSRHFYDFAVADHPRYQLMNERIVPGFEPSPESYAPSVRVMERGRRRVMGLGRHLGRGLHDLGRRSSAASINQHFANDPGGTRISALLDRAVDMWADAVGLPDKASPSSPHQEHEMSTTTPHLDVPVRPRIPRPPRHAARRDRVRPHGRRPRRPRRRRLDAPDGLPRCGTSASSPATWSAWPHMVATPLEMRRQSAQGRRRR